MNWSRRNAMFAGGVAFLACAAGWHFGKSTSVGKTQIGATADVMEINSGLVFQARVDTGAAVSSIHCAEISIQNESEDPIQNIGKLVGFRIENRSGEGKVVETAIVDYAKIKTIDATKPRYYVRLVLECKGVSKLTLVSLADRRHMDHRLLLGRDFLRGDFVVDVSEDLDSIR